MNARLTSILIQELVSSLLTGNKPYRIYNIEIIFYTVMKMLKMKMYPQTENSKKIRNSENPYSGPDKIFVSSSEHFKNWPDALNSLLISSCGSQ